MKVRVNNTCVFAAIVKEAFELCRYEWMCQTLFKLVTSRDDDPQSEALDGFLSKYSSCDAGSDRVIVPSSNFCVDSSGSKDHCIGSVSWLVLPVEREMLA